MSKKPLFDRISWTDGLALYSSNFLSVILTKFAHHTLTTSSLSSSDTVLSLVLSRSDADDLKRAPDDLARSLNSVFLGVMSGAATDYAGNDLDPVPLSDPLPLSSLTPDTASPHLLAFDLDLTLSPPILTLSFSEAVSLSSLNLTDLLFQSRYTSSVAVSHRLRGGVVLTSEDSSTVSISLLDSDVEDIKRSGQLWVNRHSAFLRIAQNLCTDLSGNKVVAIEDGFALPVSSFTADNQGPRLKYAGLEFNSGRLSPISSEEKDLRKFPFTSRELKLCFISLGWGMISVVQLVMRG